MKNPATIHSAVIQKAIHGDEQAFAWLYNQYSKSMFNVCTRMIPGYSDAQDVLQESFIIGFRELHKLREPELFGGWLKRIVLNECIRRSRKSIYWDEIEDELMQNSPGDETRWWEDVDFEVIHAAIRELPDGCRQVFTLFCLEDFTHKEISQSLDISESTSKSQYQRAKKLLKTRLTKQLNPHGLI